MDFNVTSDMAKKVMKHDGVKGLMVIDKNVLMKSTFHDTESASKTAIFNNLIDTFKKVIKDVDNDDDLALLRIRTTKREEIIIGCDNEVSIIAIQTLNIADQFTNDN